MAETISLVTGAAGFIGSHVVDALLAKGHRVLALDDLSGGFRENVSESAEFVEGSILDEALIEQMFTEHQIDYVFHLAAYAAEGLSHFIRRFNYRNNLIGSMNLINASVNAEVKCFVFTSSIAVYGANQVPMTESATPEPEDPYGIAKYAVELDLEAARRMFGLNYVVFRPHNVYGERQHVGDPYRNVIGIFFNQILQGKPLTVFGDGEQTRAFSYIDDVAPVIAESAERSDCHGEIYNIGADTPYSINQLIAQVGTVMEVDPQIRYLEARQEVVHAYSSHDKVKAAFAGRIKDVSLEEGLNRMADWVKQTGARAGKTFEHVEVMKNMPDSWRALTEGAQSN